MSAPSSPPLTSAPWHRLQALGEANLMLHQIIASAQEGIIVSDREHRCVLWSPFLERLTGKTAADVLGKRPWEAFPHLPEADLRALGERVLAGETFTAPETLASPPGREPVLWSSSRLEPLRDPAGQIVGAITFVHDVTERRQAAEALRESEELFRLVWEHSADGIRLTDGEGRMVMVNEAFCRLVGKSKAELEGQLLSVISVEARREHILRQHLKRFHGRSTPPRMERELTLWDGRRVWFELSNSFFQAEGQTPLLLSVFRDITDRKQMETELRLSRERFERIFQSNPAALGICTLAEGRFLEVNANFARLTGFTPEQISGRTDLELGLWVDLGQRSWLFDYLRQHRSLQNFEAALRVKDGNARHALASAELLELGAVDCLLLCLLDITGQKLLEQQLRQAQRMEAFGQLAGGIAHDFNNILTIIQGHAGLARHSCQLDASAQESLQEISEAVGRGANLTRQLLTFSRRQPMQARLLDLNEAVGNLTKLLCRVIGEDISLECHYSPSLPLIHADVGMIEQVLLNLALNARDAMPRGGKLSISTKVQQLEPAHAQRHPSARPGEFVCLGVQDTGSGIPPEILPHIFEPFFTTKPPGKGTGLGLATVHGVVEQHHGWVEVDSQPGLGTSFRIFLPVATQGAPGAADHQAPPAVRGGSETILLVEDEGPLRGLARRILEQYGYAVWEAPSGPAALQIWREHADAIALLLTDVIMPGGMNGRELADLLRAQKPDLRVILTSGYSTETTLRGLRPQDRLRFLQKPYPPWVLAQTVRDCLDEQ